VEDDQSEGFFLGRFQDVRASQVLKRESIADRNRTDRIDQIAKQDRNGKNDDDGAAT